ncbi:RIMS-binding protein 2 isoform X1 [Motacilla alba alba]|uniref:RIMS-binding protein 2 isoform X1 n=1 Tax=Motacilla alba alba TaxID=1094192 RepID=UPI0018D58716|nr:RIMS-binding protein 2 isoform X1 [Motacilla alba alba]
MREAAERRQQLELEHEQALAVLNAKQQEIELLQKAQVEAKKEHEGAVQLLEAKVRELEQKCRTQSEQFKLLSRELERFRQQAGKIELLGSASLAPPGPPGKALAQLMNGIATSIGKGHESPPGSRCVISEFIRPLQISGDKPEQLSVKPTLLAKSRPGTPRCRFDSDMDNDQNSNTSKQRYSGKVHLCIARYSYNPFDGPNENPEAELPLTAGKYLYVYGDMDEDGFYEGELLDGQRGLVPSNFVDFVQDSEARLGSEQEQNLLNRAGPALEGRLELSPPSRGEPGALSNGAGTLDVNIDEIGEDIVPYPRKITLIKQLAKSVIVGWEPPVVPPGWGTVSSYNVLVDKEVRMNVALGSRTKALIEKLNTSTCTYRISIQSITSKGNSDELQCTLLVGKDVIVAPSNLRVDNITQISAELSWLPTNSNYSHVIFLNEEEFDIVKAASYKYHFFNLKPNMAYKVKVMAKPHQMPWQLPLEQREKKEAFVEFSTLPAGPPAPPQDVSVRAGPTPGSVQVCWKPPALSATGTSHGASVTGYGVYAKGQRVAEVTFPAAEGAPVELPRLRALDAREVTVRTLSAQGESLDSALAAIPSDLLVPPTPHPRTAPKSKPLASAGAPETKEEHLGPHLKRDESWEQTRSVSPVHGHMLEPPTFHGPLQGRRSPSPNRILPQPQGTPVPNTVAKAMAREAAQRVAESNRVDRRSVFSERSVAVPYSDEEEEEDGYDSPRVKRRGASVDDFLKESELGKQAHYCLGDEYHTESSRGSDLSDILEEDEEELYSEMQLEEGGRRRLSLTSHGALKEYDKNKATEATFLEQPGFPQQTHHSKRLFSIPEVAEEDGEHSEVLYKQGLGMPYKKHPRIARGPRARRPCNQEQQHSPRHPGKARAEPGLQELDERGCRCRQTLSRSPDSGLDCGSEDEEPRHHGRAPGGSDQEQPWLHGRRRNGSDEEQPWLHGRAQRGSDEEQPWLHGRHRNGSDEEQPWLHGRAPGVRDEEQPWFRGRHRNGSDEERSQHSSRPQWGSDEERPRFRVTAQRGSAEEEPRPSFRHRGGSDEEEPRHSVRPQWGSEEEEPRHRFRHRGGSDEERPRHGGRAQWGSEEEEPRHGARHRGGSEEEEPWHSVRPQWGSEEEQPRPRFRHRGGGEEEEPRHSPQLPPEARPCRRAPRPLLARRRTLTRQSSIEEDFGELAAPLGQAEAPRGRRAQRGAEPQLQGGRRSHPTPGDSRAAAVPAKPSHRDAEDSLLLGNPASAGRPDRVEHAGRRSSHGSAVPQRSRPLLVPSIDGYGGHDRLSPDIYEESETDPGTEDLSTRIFVALFDYDPLTMSPNPDAAEEELPFKEGQIIKVYGDKDADGFYRGETCARVGLIPCNMVSEIQADDEEMMDQLLKQGFLPLNTPIEKIERGGRRGGRQQPLTTRRMVALYDYDPRESSPNVDVEAELTFCTGDIITVFGEIDEDGFYYGELNGQKGLVPSNFLEEVPDDVEVFLSDAPSRYAHDTPARSKAKRVPPENTGTSRRAPSPTVHLHSGSPPSPMMGSGSPGRGRDMASKKKKGLLSKGKKLLKKLGAVK